MVKKQNLAASFKATQRRRRQMVEQFSSWALNETSPSSELFLLIAGSRKKNNRKLDLASARGT